MDGPLLPGQARHLYFFLGDRYGTAITGAVDNTMAIYHAQLSAIDAALEMMTKE